MTKISVETLELLASKICHDLISPIGAVNNGLEIFEEMGPEAGADVTDLISFSASQASAKLKAYRMAYGAGGADSNIRVDDVYDAIEDIIAQEGKVKQSWDPKDAIGRELPPKAFCKVLICTLLLAKDSLPRGGELLVEHKDDRVFVIASGEGSKLKPGFESALAANLTDGAIEASVTHAYITGLISQNYGFKVSAENTKEHETKFTIALPSF